MSIVDELVAVFTYKYEGKADAAQFQRDLDNTAKKAQAAAAAVTTRLADFGDGITKVMSRAVLGFAAITGAGGAALGKGVIEASAQWEGFEAALTTIEGSSEKAKQSLDWISGFAKRTPYDLAGVVESFTKLRSYGLDAADGTLETLGNAASAMNKPLNSAVEMFADAASFQFERMREFGIVATQKGEEVSFQFQKDGKTVRETVKKTGSAVTGWIKNNLEGRFAGAMIRQSKTWDGLMSNLGDSWEDFKRRIGAGGFFDTVKGKLGDLLEYIATLDSNGTLDRWSKNLSWAFEGVSNGVVEMARQLKGNIETIGQLWEQGGWSEKLKPFAAALGVLAAALFPVTTMLAVGALAINDWLTYMAGGDSVIGGFIDRLSELLGAKPEEVARVLGELAKGGAWFAVAAGGIALFASAIRKLSGALVLLKAAGWAVKLLARLAGIRWGAAAAGAAGAAVEGAAATAGAGTVATATGAGAMATAGIVGGLATGALLASTVNAGAGSGKANALSPIMPGDQEAALLGSGAAKDETVRPYTRQPMPSKAEAERDSMSSLREQFGSLMDRFGSFMAGIKGSDVIDAAGLVSTLRGIQSMTQSVSAPANMSAVVNDSRSFPVTNNISAPVSVSVTQAVQAPAAVGRAIATAVGMSAVMPRAAVVVSPSN